MKRRTFWSGFIVGFILTIVALFIVIKSTLVQPDVSLRKIKVEDLNGREVNLLEMLGKPIVINYWATWCVPCKREFPEFETTKKQWENKVTFLMISDEKSSVIEAFKESKPYSFNYLRSLKGFEDVTSRPTTYIYDNSGKLVTKHTGTISAKELTEILKKLE